MLWRKNGGIQSGITGHYIVTKSYDVFTLLPGKYIVVDRKVTQWVTQLVAPKVASVAVQYGTVLRGAKHHILALLVLK